MTSETICRKCGVPLGAGTRSNFCPACLYAELSVQPVGQDAVTQLASAADAASRDESSFNHSSPPGPSAARSFGDYELLEEIARGGMGIVYKARQKSLDRIVAVKMILAGQFAGKHLIQRFRAEVTAAALLQHPNIVAIHEVGVHEEQHFFAMDYVEGQNLAQLAGNRPMPAHKAARYVKLIAEAIHYAHQQGILHRDLKPSNVLIDARTDQPRISDFGLAKRLDGESSLTMTGQVLGSPNFMPPEQVSAQRGKVGRPSDVYGLGGILYHLLTLRAPFQAESIEGIVTQVLSAEPVAPRLLNASVPRDLERICLKCLEKEPSRRYQTAQELSDELDRFLRDVPILARPVTRYERVWRWCRLHPAITSLAAATSLLVLTVAIGSPIAALRINRERQRSNYNASESRQRLVRLNVANGNRLVEEGDLLGALPWYVEAMKLEQSNPAREQMHRARIESVLQQSPRIVQLWYQPSFTGPGLLPQVSSNGRYLLFDDRIKSAEGTVETEVRVVDVTTGEPIFPPLKVEGFVYAKDISPDSRRFVLASGSPKGWLSGPGEARIWDAVTGAPVTPPLQHSGAVENVLFSPDGRHLLTVEQSLEPAKETRARIWNPETGEPLTPSLMGLASRRFDRFSPDGQRIITVTSRLNPPGDKIEIRVWHAATGETVQPPQVYAGVWPYDLSHDGQRLLVELNEGIRPGPFMVWDVRTGQPISPRWRPREQILEGHFSPDSSRIIVTTRKSLQVWDAASGTPLSAPVKHRNQIRQVRFSPDSQLVISTSVDETARVLDAALGELVCPPLLHDFAAHSGSFTTKGDTVLTRTANQVTRLWKMPSNDSPGRALHHKGPVRCAAFSRDGDRVLTASVDGTARLWDAATGTQLKTFWHGGAVMDAAFSSDGRLVVTASEDRTARIWNAITGEPLTDPLPHNGVVWHAEFSRDSLRVLTAAGSSLPQDTRFRLFSASSPKATPASSDHGEARIWDARTGKQLLVFSHSNTVTHAEFSPDGTKVVTASADQTARVWDAVSGLPITPVLRHGMTVYYATFSPNGRRVLTACLHWSLMPREAQIWDAVTGQPVGAPLRHAYGVATASYSPDGKRVATASRGGTARIWDADTGASITSPLRHGDEVCHVVFSADGTRIATASWDHTARIWEAATGEPVAPALRHANSVAHVSFSRDGHRLVTACDDGTARIWELERTQFSTEDLARYCQLLSSRRVDATGAGLQPVEAGILTNLWHTLRAKYPDEFAPARR